MGLFNKMFGKLREPKTVTRFELINDNDSGFFSWGGQLYQSDIVRACIRPKAKAIGKLVAKHTRDFSEELEINPYAHMRFLLEEPNPLMTGQVLQEKLTIQLELNNNAFAFIKRDDLGNAMEIYPVPCISADVVENDYGDIFLVFYFKNGKKMTAPYDDVIHIRKDFNDNDFFGDPPGEVLSRLMDVVTTTDQGIIKAVKNGAIVKWILKFKSVLKKEDVDMQVSDFVKNYMSIEKANGGAAYTDPRYDLEQVKPGAYVPDSKQMQETIQRIYNFFNTNEKIIQSKYTENEWNSYYESEIEPLAMQLSGEYTRKLFSRRERGFGNKIVFEVANLQYASLKTKINLLQMVDRGAMTPDEWRGIMGFAPIEGGDKPIRRLDTAVVGKEKGEGGDGGDGSGEEESDD